MIKILDVIRFLFDDAPFVYYQVTSAQSFPRFSCDYFCDLWSSTWRYSFASWSTTSTDWLPIHLLIKFIKSVLHSPHSSILLPGNIVINNFPFLCYPLFVAICFCIMTKHHVISAPYVLCVSSTGVDTFFNDIKSSYCQCESVPAIFILSFPSGE